MPNLPTDTRIILGIIAAIAGVTASLVGNVLAINIVYFFTRSGRKPTKRPLMIWVIFFTSVFVSVVFGSVAAFAETPQENNSTRINNATIATEQVNIQQSKTPNIPTAIPATPTLELIFYTFDTKKLEKTFVYMGFDNPPEIEDGDLNFDYQAGESYGERQIIVDLSNRQIFFVSTSVAVDEATPDSFAFIQVHAYAKDKGEVVYANFGVKDTGEIFISTVSDRNTIGDNILTFPGRPLGEPNSIFIGYTPRGMIFYANDEEIYTIDTIGTGSFYASIIVSGSNNGYIKSRWASMSWQYGSE